jgi:hypothetical protein
LKWRHEKVTSIKTTRAKFLVASMMIESLALVSTTLITVASLLTVGEYTPSLEVWGYFAFYDIPGIVSHHVQK